MASISTAYISASANRFSTVASTQGSLVAFGSGKYVSLWDVVDPSDRGVMQTLAGHEADVTCASFIPVGGLVTTDNGGCLKFWGRNPSKWSILASLDAHAAPISSISVTEDYIATASSDSTVKVWRTRSDDVPELMQTINLGKKLPLSISLAALPASNALVLAIGSTDRTLQVWARSDALFTHVATLSGHEDWIKATAFLPPRLEGEPLVLASGSQDGTIRLWNIESSAAPKQSAGKSSTDASVLTDELLEAFEASLSDLAEADEGGRQISMKHHIFSLKVMGSTTKQYTITFDALLVGHEAGVTSLSWRPGHKDLASANLLSTSTDSSVIIWSQTAVATQNETTSLWTNHQRFGDIGGQRLGGFVGGLWAVDGREALAWGWSGGWRRWRQDLESWSEVGAICGHNGPVKGISWSPAGEYLISTSLDQTSRIHGETARSEASGNQESNIWHEIARPQVHGYDLLRAVFLSPLRFVSIADEKVARVFDAPRGFVNSVEKFGLVKLSVDQSTLPIAASVPPLGLSNKAVDNASVQISTVEGQEPDRRPFEGELAGMTLWPEVEKVFGHGYEGMTIAASPSRTMIATACKATSAEHAVVRVYDTSTWKQLGEPLAGHNLTVTRIVFSPDDRHILSVSRDRTWRLFKAREDGVGFVPIAANKQHARIVWDCAWATEGDAFVTASRDKTVCVWKLPDGELPAKWSPICTIKCDEGATAVAFAPEDTNGRRLLAVGLETGVISIFSSRSDASQWKLECSIDRSMGHINHIYQLDWRPSNGITKQLASCSEDGTVKILNVGLETESRV